MVSTNINNSTRAPYQLSLSSIQTVHINQRVINLFIISITYHLNHNTHAENKRKNEQFLCKNVDENQIINTTTLGNCTQSRGRNT